MCAALWVQFRAISRHANRSNFYPRWPVCSLRYILLHRSIEMPKLISRSLQLKFLVLLNLMIALLIQLFFQLIDYGAISINSWSHTLLKLKSCVYIPEGSGDGTIHAWNINMQTEVSISIRQKVLITNLSCCIDDVMWRWCLLLCGHLGWIMGQLHRCCFLLEMGASTCHVRGSIFCPHILDTQQRLFREWSCC